MPKTSESTAVATAAQIAHHVGEYEKAWRTADNMTARTHLLALERLCNNDPQASIIRGACTVAAALTRDTPCVDERDRGKGEHLKTVAGRETLIFEYFNGEQIITPAEYGIAA